ncbi:CaiB/BaiF CoA transferase family protein [Sinosporangium album]|uniref:CaiB/BaiF CoA transferase family protein n=1 Tax=Sinosporangium album TaxID=504805 RepID=UPI0015A3EE23|nr:CoA transferase [Sinosporangium album]
MTVLDLTQVVSGAVSTMLMADFGATVIKVEPPGGEPYRKFGTPIRGEKGETNFNFLRWSRGKHSVVIDLKTEEGREVLWSLIDQSDVLVENFKAGTFESLGFSAARLRERNPRLVYSTVSGFGHGDLMKSVGSELPVYAIIAEAMAGITYLAADGDDQPVWLGFAMADILSGVLAFTGTLLALRQRDQSADHPLRVDIAMHDSSLFMNDQAMLRYSLTEQVEPPGRKYSLQSPWGFYPAADGHFAIAVMTPAQWRGVCSVIGRADLADRADLQSGTDRSKLHDEVIEPAIHAWAKTRSKHEAVALLAQANVPCAPVNHAGDVFNSPEAQSRDMLVTVEDTHVGAFRQIGNPIKLAGVERQETPRIRSLGEDTREILTRVLGMEADRITALQSAGVVGGR